MRQLSSLFLHKYKCCFRQCRFKTSSTTKCIAISQQKKMIRKISLRTEKKNNEQYDNDPHIEKMHERNCNQFLRQSVSTRRHRGMICNLILFACKYFLKLGLTEHDCRSCILINIMKEICQAPRWKRRYFLFSSIPHYLLLENRVTILFKCIILYLTFSSLRLRNFFIFCNDF